MGYKSYLNLNDTQIRNFSIKKLSNLMKNSQNKFDKNIADEYEVETIL
jgi:hypothetical protein